MFLDYTDPYFWCSYCRFLSSFICFCRESDLLRTEDSFSLTERSLSNDSLKASSGEVSPYDNNSPVLSDRLLCKYPEDSSLISRSVPRHSRQDELSGHPKDEVSSTSTLSDKGTLIFLLLLFQSRILRSGVTHSHKPVGTREAMWGFCERLNTQEAVNQNKLRIRQKTLLLNV